MLKTIVAALVGALLFSGLALAGSQSEIYKLSAKLTAGAEVPKPKGVPASATGSFTGTTIEPKTGKVKLSWKLTFAHLSGQATAAHIHLGVKGKAGGVIVALCGPCKSGQTGKALVARSVERNLEAGKTYVNIHTKKNPAGEIRGQVKVTGG
jgi:CHRD domain